MSSATELLFLGMPETGKTTFFVALDEVLQTENHGLVSNGFAANRTYLENAKALWRAGKQINRTNLVPVNEPVELLVRQSESNSVARLIAPDVYGEFYDDQWADRKWPISFRERLAKLAGVMLFVAANRTGRNPEMTAIWQTLSSPAAKAKPWDARRSSEQLKLVDLLQAIVEKGKVRKQLPIAVVISAWDLLETFDEPKLNPSKFIETEWSLLNQFLTSNSDRFSFRIYGVSAQGGDTQFQDTLIEKLPAERVWLKEGNEVTRDLTRPIRWLLGWQ